MWSAEGALALAIFSILTIFAAHTPWSVPYSRVETVPKFMLLLVDLAMCGGFLVVVASYIGRPTTTIPQYVLLLMALGLCGGFLLVLASYMRRGRNEN